MKTVFLRVLEEEEKPAALLKLARDHREARGRHRFEVNVSNFTAVPHSPFAYWVSDALRSCFLNSHRTHYVAKLGLKTDDDFRFIRLWNELRAGGTDYKPLAKGGSYSPIYSDIHLVLQWRTQGWELKSLSTERWGNPGKRIFNEHFYFRPGLTWPRRTQGGLSLRIMPVGCIFADKGPAIFTETDATEDLLALLAVMNSRAFKAMVDMQMAFGSYEVGVLQRTPVPTLMESVRTDFARLARQAWSLKRSLDSRAETSHAFILPALLQVDAADMLQRFSAWAKRVCSIIAELARIQSKIDDSSFTLYAIDETDRCAITKNFGSHKIEENLTSDTNADEDVDEDDNENGSEEDRITDAIALTSELISWTLGVVFGRFDVRLATTSSPQAIEPEPFDPLPVCSPGMLTGADGLPLTRAPEWYPLSFPENGVLVDDLGHAQDLPTAVRAVFDVIFGSDADRWWTDVGALLDPKNHDLRAWIAGSFFEYHIKRYSKSRRKAPILWQLGTASGRYSLWLYAHRLTRDSFFQLQTEVVAPKVAHEERQLTSLTQNAGSSPTPAARKEIAAQESLVDELRTMLDEVKRIAPLWNPDLDDGVVLTMAPLWRLVPQHKTWQKELRTHFSDLAAGKYDWAHLAMHLWPERVVPKCASDRSLAIAHGLEALLWVTDFSGAWQPRRPRAKALAHVVSALHDATLILTLTEVRTFWKAHYAGTLGAAPNWWQQLEEGQHDTESLAYALWPERIVKKAATERAVAEAHKLLALYEAQQRTPSGSAGGTGKAERKLKVVLHPRLSAADLAVLRTFCDVPGDAEAWASRWQAFDAGDFDATSALALHVRADQVVKLGTENEPVAEHHGFARWFWLREGAESRRLDEPDEELSRAVAARTSQAVNAALQSLLDAPAAHTSKVSAGPRGGR